MINLIIRDIENYIPINSPLFIIYLLSLPAGSFKYFPSFYLLYSACSLIAQGE